MFLSMRNPKESPNRKRINLKFEVQNMMWPELDKTKSILSITTTQNGWWKAFVVQVTTGIHKSDTSEATTTIFGSICLPVQRILQPQSLWENQMIKPAWHACFWPILRALLASCWGNMAPIIHDIKPLECSQVGLLNSSKKIGYLTIQESSVIFGLIYWYGRNPQGILTITSTSIQLRCPRISAKSSSK